MRRFAAAGVALSVGVFAFAQEASAANPRIAAAQVALRAHGIDPGRSTASRAADPRRSRVVPASAEAAPRRQAGSRHASRVRSARTPAARSARARGRGGRVGRRRARVPAPALRTVPAGGRRALPGRDGGGTEALPAAHAHSTPTVSPGRTRTALSPGVRRLRDPHRPRGRELLLDRRQVPREPVAARPQESHPAHPRHRSRPATRAPGRGARPASVSAARVSGRHPGGDRPLVARLRRRPEACARACVDGVGVPAGRRLERRRDRRHAAPARRPGSSSTPSSSGRQRLETTRATSRRAFATCAGSSTSSAVTGDSPSRAGTRERGQCARSACTTTRSCSCAWCSHSTARSEGVSSSPSAIAAASQSSSRRPPSNAPWKVGCASSMSDLLAGSRDRGSALWASGDRCFLACAVEGTRRGRAGRAS